MRIRSDSTPPGKYPRGVHGSRIETGEKSKRDLERSERIFRGDKNRRKKKYVSRMERRGKRGEGLADAWIVVRGGPLERGREKEGKKGG